MAEKEYEKFDAKRKELSTDENLKQLEKDVKKIKRH